MRQDLVDAANAAMANDHNYELDSEKSELLKADKDALAQAEAMYRGKLQVHKSDNLSVMVPPEMNLLGASIEIFEQYKESETKESFSFDFKNRYYVDSLYVVHNLLQEHLGRIKPVSNKHNISDVVVKYDEHGNPIRKTIFEGFFIVPAFENARFKIQANDTMSVTLSTGGLKKKFEKPLRVMVKAINTLLSNTSLYDGANVKVSTKQTMFGEVWSFEPFYNKSNPNIILNEAEDSVISDYIIPDLNFNKKRSYLFCGGYGNGKTETAMTIGEAATREGYLFVYVKKSDDFTKILSISKSYKKLLIFMEDLDELASGDERGAHINNVLNTLDGIDSKNSNVKVIFTTNHENKLNPALRRPGRLDLIIRFENPEISTAIRIMDHMLEKVTFEATEDKELMIDTKAAIELLASFGSEGQRVSGAVVAEVCNRAIRMGELHEAINQKHLIACVNSIKTQVKMMEEDIHKDDLAILQDAAALLGSNWNRDIKQNL